MQRRAKIVCTIGPAVATPDGVLALVEAGMDVARLNFSHGTQAEHARAYRLVREASDRTGHAVAVLADLQGPKIRLGTFADGGADWATGDEVTITTEDIVGAGTLVGTTYVRFAHDVKPGDRVLVDDGRVDLQVLDTDGIAVRLRVLDGGRVSNNKGMNLPGIAVSEPALTDKDVEDLRFALGLRVDLVALSFVRQPDDADRVRAVMREEGALLPVLAKVEKPEAVHALDEIIAAFDGVLVARGDLGVEMPLEDVPLVQKRAVALCRDNAKPVIVATQMLESMIDEPRPTRAEASDVANAVLDGTDAVMLSGETSVGRHPIEAVKTMSRIVMAAETGRGPYAVRPLTREPRTQSGAIARAAVEIAHQLEAAALVAFTMGGDTARRLARHHSSVPLLAFTPVQVTRSQLAVSWGVETFFTETVSTLGEMVKQVDEVLLATARARPGELIVVVAGVPIATPGATNTIRVHRVGGDR
ncbi:MAG TPA: pyruvate kinase [Mycobacteriales bacterium]|nr:pyruvate kinase [Mycobacteriales bacterium]